MTDLSKTKKPRREALEEIEDGKIWAMNPREQKIRRVKPDMLRLGMVPVIQDRTEQEHMTYQLALYMPCPCGSGKKLKFCHKTWDAVPKDEQENE